MKKTGNINNIPQMKDDNLHSECEIFQKQSAQSPSPSPKRTFVSSNGTLTGSTMMLICHLYVRSHIFPELQFVERLAITIKSIPCAGFSLFSISLAVWAWQSTIKSQGTQLLGKQCCSVLVMSRWPLAAVVYSQGSALHPALLHLIRRGGAIGARRAQRWLIPRNARSSATRKQPVNSDSGSVSVSPALPGLLRPFVSRAGGS